MGNSVMPPKRRKIVLPSAAKAVDYNLLKSIIRDEVDLQVSRKLKEIIKPLYQVIMSDPRYDVSSTILPEWATTLLAESGADSGTERELDVGDEDYWNST